MAQQVVMDVKGWDSFIRVLDNNLKDPIKILKAAFNTRGFKDVIQHFEEEKGPDGKWKRSQRAIRENGQTLQDTGNLRQNFRPTNVRKLTSHAIVFYNPAQSKGGFYYGKVHDEGLKGMPKREFMWLSNEAQDDMIKIILDLVVK